jgi:hypothetical protein
MLLAPLKDADIDLTGIDYQSPVTTTNELVYANNGTKELKFLKQAGPVTFPDVPESYHQAAVFHVCPLDYEVPLSTLLVEAIPGNHDPDGHGSVWRDRAMANLPNLRLHRVPGPIEAHGVTLLPLPVTDATSAMDALRTLPDGERGRAIQIALGHGHVTAWSFGGHEDEVRLPLDITHVDRSGIDFLALGHWHGTRTRPGADGAVRVAYSGTHEQTKFTETGAGNVLVVEIAQPGATPVVEEHRVAQLVWAVVAFEFGRDGAMPELDAALAGTDADLIQITLTGPFPIAHRDRLATLLAKHRGRFQHTKLEQNLRWTREASSGHAIADPGLRDALGEIEKMIESLDDQTSVGAEAARRARDLLLELDEDAAR